MSMSMTMSTMSMPMTMSNRKPNAAHFFGLWALSNESFARAVTRAPGSGHWRGKREGGKAYRGKGSTEHDGGLTAARAADEEAQATVPVQGGVDHRARVMRRVAAGSAKDV